MQSNGKYCYLWPFYGENSKNSTINEFHFVVLYTAILGELIAVCSFLCPQLLVFLLNCLQIKC